jgi:hypothetical protein
VPSNPVECSLGRNRQVSADLTEVLSSSDSVSNFPYLAKVFKSRESATVIVLPIFAAALAACTPSSQDNTLPNSGPAPGHTVKGFSRAASEVQGSNVSRPAARGAGGSQSAAPGPISEPVSMTANAAAAKLTDSPAAARGRRTLSTAFVRVGPDGRLTLELADGGVLVLRDVVMRPKDYCGLRIVDGSATKQFCGKYGEIEKAWPSGAPVADGADQAVPISPSSRQD